MQGLPIKETKPEHANTSLGAIMAIPATRVIAFNREGEDLSYVGSTYKNRPLTIIKSPSNADLSSTKARLAVKQRESLADMVPSQVLKIIQENELYKN
jgi:nicotinic acid mononucleotide adenylyltransferase